MSRPNTYWAISRTSDLGKETEMKALRPHFNVVWLSKHNAARHSEREKKKIWEDNVEEWTKMVFAGSYRAA